MKNSTTKIYTFVFLLITLMIVSSCGISNTDTPISSSEEISELTPIQREYQYYVKSFVSVTTTDLSTSNDNYFLYTGRITCPYCLAFVPKLYQASLLPENNDSIIRYLDSENENDEGLDKFFELNHIEYVPNLSYYEEGELTETMDVTSTTTIEEIQEFMNSMN